MKKLTSGVQKEITINREDTCEVCKGSGAKDTSKVETCSVCGGTGQVKQVQTTILRTNANYKNL